MRVRARVYVYMYVRMYVCVCECVCARARVCMYVCVCLSVCLYVCVLVYQYAKTRENGSREADRAETVSRALIDPSTEPTRSPISTNQRREMLLFLARIFGSHAGITNNGSAHTDSVRFCRFWFNRPTAKWLYGFLQGNRLRTISSSKFYG